jgi:Icc protein
MTDRPYIRQMKIIQITDLHLPDREEVSSKAFSQAWTEWECMLDEIEGRGADLLVNTGDICRSEPGANIYRRYYQGLRSLATPILNLAGNHDQLDLLFRHERTDPVLKKGAFTLLFLHCVGDQLYARHRSILLDELERGGKPLVIFMHYPPLYAGAPYMDGQHAFSEISTLLPSLEQARRKVEIFCGHYHMARSLKSGALSVHITPSPYMNIDPAFEDRRDCDRYKNPYREITLEGNALQQTLHGVKSSKSIDF